MATTRKIEIFSAGCAVCEEVVAMVKHASGPSDEIIVCDMKDITIVRRAKSLGVRSVPAVVINGSWQIVVPSAALMSRHYGQPGLGVRSRSLQDCPSWALEANLALWPLTFALVIRRAAVG